MKKKVLSLVGLVFMSFVLLLTGCAGEGIDNAQGRIADAQGTAIADTGTLILKVNPEIAIDYDENGKVTGVRGINDDGEEIISEYPDYIGKNSDEVLEDLIALIGEAGYFVEEVEGEPRKIVIELEAGSPLPDEDFLERMAVNAQGAVEEYKLGSDVEVAGETYISIDEAKQIALKHAQIDGSSADFDDAELDVDDGLPVYELEFEVGADEFEYDIHAATGEIIDYEHDLETKREAARPANKQAARSKAQAKEKKASLISLDEAKKIAFNHAGVEGSKARFDDQELDDEDGVPVYELEFEVGVDEFEYDIHAATGEIIDYEHDLEIKREAARPANKQAARSKAQAKEKKASLISLDEAKKIAFSHAGVDGSKARFDDQELDDEDGVPVYELEFEIGDVEFEYDIHALTGSILEAERD